MLETEERNQNRAPQIMRHEGEREGWKRVLDRNVIRMERGKKMLDEEWTRRGKEE